MLTINHMMPFHPQYQRPQAIITSKKEDSNDKPMSFKEILNYKMGKKA